MRQRFLGQCSCPFFNMCIVSIPVISFCALQNDLKPIIGSVNHLSGVLTGDSRSNPYPN